MDVEGPLIVDFRIDFLVSLSDPGFCNGCGLSAAGTAYLSEILGFIDFNAFDLRCSALENVCQHCSSLSEQNLFREVDKTKMRNT